MLLKVKTGFLMLDNFSYVIDGVLAGCAHPGSFGSCSEGLRELKAEGIAALVSLDETGVAPHLIADADLHHLHLPIPDFGTPSVSQARDFIQFVRRERQEGHAVAVHCRAGYGRTGTMLACFLVSEGCTPDDAIDQVRDVRPGSIETAEQEDFIRVFAEDSV